MSVVFFTTNFLLCGEDFRPPSRIRSQFTSKSGRLTVELCATYPPPTAVYIYPSAKPQDRTLLFQEENGLTVDAAVSDDDRLIVVRFGGPSYGEHLAVFVRCRKGTYSRDPLDISERAWRLVKNAKSLPATASAAHLYCAVAELPTNPLSVVFKFAGNYSAKEQGQTNFGPMLVRYLVHSKKMEIIDEPLDKDH